MGKTLPRQQLGTPSTGTTSAAAARIAASSTGPSLSTGWGMESESTRTVGQAPQDAPAAAARDTVYRHYVRSSSSDCRQQHRTQPEHRLGYGVREHSDCWSSRR